MGLCLSGIISAILENTECLSWYIPNDLTTEDAATMPLMFTMVSQTIALINISKLNLIWVPVEYNI